MSDPRPEPTRGLSSQAVGLWTLAALGWSVPGAIVLVLLLQALDAPDWALLSAIVLGVAVVVVAAGVRPRLRMRRWRWEVRDEEIDLRHGPLTEVRTLVPMSRVQHVDVRRSFLQQQSAAADLVIHTAAGATTIPMLPDGDALEVRDRIAGLAQARDGL